MEIAENIHLIAPSWAYVYLVTSEKMAFVDTGLPQYLEDIISYVRKAGLRLSDVSFIINTHVHGDHVGCNKALKGVSGAKLAVHELDAKYIEDPDTYLKDTFRHTPPSQECVSESKSWKDKVDIHLKDGQMIDLGDTILEVVHTPGHTPGSISLYDRDRKILFSGDALSGTSEFVKEFGPVTGLYVNLDTYVNSINRLLKLDIRMILPGHPVVIKGADAHKELQNCLDRVNYINSKILEILEKRKMTLKRLTETLGIPIDEWNLMTIESHLHSLVDNGYVEKEGAYFSAL